jgi:hypothetical protein
MELRFGGDGAAWLYLAMATWQKGDQEQARKWYDEAVLWMEQADVEQFLRDPKRQDDEMRRLRAEAAQLLGVKEKPAAQPTSSKQ